MHMQRRGIKPWHSPPGWPSFIHWEAQSSLRKHAPLKWALGLKQSASALFTPTSDSFVSHHNINIIIITKKALP